MRPPRRLPLEAVDGAPCLAVRALEIPAGHVEYRVGVKVALVGPEGPESDLLGVTQQPGGLVVQRSPSLVEPADPQQHTEAHTLGAQPLAGRRGTPGLASS